MKIFAALALCLSLTSAAFGYDGEGDPLFQLRRDGRQSVIVKVDESYNILGIYLQGVPQDIRYESLSEELREIVTKTTALITKLQGANVNSGTAEELATRFVDLLSQVNVASQMLDVYVGVNEGINLQMLRVNYRQAVLRFRLEFSRKLVEENLYATMPAKRDFWRAIGSQLSAFSDVSFLPSEVTDVNLLGAKMVIATNQNAKFFSSEPICGSKVDLLTKFIR